MKNGKLQKLHKKIQNLKANETARYIYLICLLFIGIISLVSTWNYRTGFDAGLAQGEYIYNCVDITTLYIKQGKLRTLGR